jgi:putative permease
MTSSHHVINRNDYGKLIAAMLFICLLALAGYALQHTVTCFLLSWIIAYLLDPILVICEEKRIKRIYSIAILYLVLGILSIFVVAIMIPKLTMSWDSLVRELPQYISKIKTMAIGWKEQFPDQYGSTEIQWILDKASGNVDKTAQKIGTIFYTFSTTILFNIFNIVLSPILVFFMLYYKHDILATLTSCLPDNRRDIITYIGLEVNSSIGGYLRGQVVISIIVAVFTTAALYILEIPHPIFCGLFAGAASTLPFIGILIAIVPATMFAWFKYQTLAIVLQTIGSFSLIYFVEGYIIKPLVFKKSMDLNPLMTIIMVMSLGELIGFWGILLALPIAAAIKITWIHYFNGDFKDNRLR